jgi:hypothetical protein
MISRKRTGRRAKNEEIGGRWMRDENEEIGDGGGMRMKRLEMKKE